MTNIHHHDTAFGRNPSTLLHLPTFQRCFGFLLISPDIQYILQMSNPTLPENQDLDEEAYNSAEDEDFELDEAPDDSDLSSDAEAAEPAKKKRKTVTQSQPLEDAELDSGDEATIRKAREKKEKAKGKKTKGKRARDSDEDDGDIDMDDDEGGTGGFVRTRAMKQQM